MGGRQVAKAVCDLSPLCGVPLGQTGSSALSTYQDEVRTVSHTLDLYSGSIEIDVHAVTSSILFLNSSHQLG